MSPIFHRCHGGHLIFKFDCRYFVGEKPCKFKRECPGCPEYDPMGVRILIIKLGAIGDVLRTTTILPALKRMYPQSHITWVVDPVSYEVLAHNPLIDRLLLLNLDTALQIPSETFDLAINLDKVPRATGLMMQSKAKQKLGFGLTSYGTLCPLNPESEYALMLGISDELKFRRNHKTYQEIIFEACTLPYKRDFYTFVLRPEHEAYAKNFLESTGLGNISPRVGLNTGSGPVFATKRWELDRYAELARRLWDQNVGVILMGGKDEQPRNAEIQKHSGIPLFNSGGKHSIKEFAALIAQLDVLVTGDTLAMHLAVAVKTPVIVLFGSTCAQEVDLYDRGEKIVANVPCSPCYLSTCEIYDMACMKSIEVETVLNAILRLLQVDRDEYICGAAG